MLAKKKGRKKPKDRPYRTGSLNSRGYMGNEEGEKERKKEKERKRKERRGKGRREKKGGGKMGEKEMEEKNE